jgi:hypothetical protein
MKIETFFGPEMATVHGLDNFDGGKSITRATAPDK